MQLADIDEQMLLMALRHIVRAVHEQEQRTPLEQGSDSVPGGHLANSLSQPQPGTAEACAAAIASAFDQQAIKETISNEFAALSLQQVPTPEGPQLASKAAIEPRGNISLPRHPAARTLPAAAAFFEAASVAPTGENLFSDVNASLAAPQVLNDDEHLQALAEGHAVRGFICTFCDHYNMVRK